MRDVESKAPVQVVDVRLGPGANQHVAFLPRIAKYAEKSNRRCYPDIANPPRPSNAQLTVPGSISQPAPAPATSLPLCPQ